MSGPVISIRYWKNLRTNKSLNYFKILKSIFNITSNTKNLDAALDALAPDFGYKLYLVCLEYQRMTVVAKLQVRYESANPQEIPFKRIDACLPSERVTFELYDNADNQPYVYELDLFATTLRNRNATFIREKSGLILAEIYAINFEINHNNPLNGESYKPLPKFLEHKKAIINVQNRDNRCFGYAVLAALYQFDNHPHRPWQYTDELFEEQGLDLITYPVNSSKLPEIEQKLNLSINLHSYFDDEGKGLYPLYTSRIESPIEIDLLYFNNHYAWIKNFSRLYTAQITKNEHEHFFCKKCYSHYNTVERYNRHKQICTRKDFCSIIHLYALQLLSVL